MRRTRRSYDAAAWLVDSWVSTYTAIANGELDGVSSAIPDLTGHSATILRQLLDPPT
jgi:NAD(P)H dehydrogenase (quinone)